jgi:hypothetical protein
MRQTDLFGSLDYLREILDNCADAVAVLNERRQIVFYNRALCRLTRRAQGHGLIGSRFGEALQCVWTCNDCECGAGEACANCGTFLSVCDGLEGLYGSRECRFTQVVDGRTEWLDLSINVSPAFVEGERFLVCSIRDVSAEKRKAVLERIFFHDLMNNIAGVELLARVLGDMVEGGASNIAQQISASTSQLIEEVQSQQLLLAAEREELAVTPVALGTGAFLESVAARFGRHPAAEGRAIGIDPGSSDVTISTDEAVLSRVLDNMVKNALEASERGQTVRLACLEAGDEVEFRVQNQGVMTDLARTQVFQRSFSTKGNGRGLGTYSMRLLSERYLKGRVTFRSNEAEGTIFLARYPKDLGPARPADTAASRPTDWAIL